MVVPGRLMDKQQVDIIGTEALSGFAEFIVAAMRSFAETSAVLLPLLHAQTESMQSTASSSAVIFFMTAP